MLCFFIVSSDFCFQSIVVVVRLGTYLACRTGDHGFDWFLHTDKSRTKVILCAIIESVEVLHNCNKTK